MTRQEQIKELIDHSNLLINLILDEQNSLNELLSYSNLNLLDQEQIDQIDDQFSKIRDILNN